jgi:hypothetical protein
MFKARFLSVALLATLLGAFVIAPLSAEAKPQTAAVPVGVTGTATNAVGNPLTFTGTYTLNQIVSNAGNLTAVGTLTGTLTDALGNVLGTVTDLPVSIPLTASGSCQILDLTLGPLDLDLLGLQVHLDTVHLNITAQQGSGNLLGNLLCAVAHLLDSNASGNALANLLNRILGLLG